MIKHKRVTGVTTTNPTKVNGKDWDEPHDHVIGALVPVAVGQYTWFTNGLFVVGDNTTAALGTPTAPGAGQKTIPLTLPDVAVVSGAAELVRVFVSGTWRDAPDAQTQIEAVYSGGNIVLRCYYASELSHPPGMIDLVLQVYVEVVAA